jgi:Flp pilus assembly protein TadG
MINKHYQKGAETVEFAIIALLFFAIIFAIIEFGRALFVWGVMVSGTSFGKRLTGNQMVFRGGCRTGAQ